MPEALKAFSGTSSLKLYDKYMAGNEKKKKVLGIRENANAAIWHFNS